MFLSLMLIWLVSKEIQGNCVCACECLRVETFKFLVV